MKCSKKIRSYFLKYLEILKLNEEDTINVFVLFSDFKKLDEFINSYKTSEKVDNILNYHNKKITILFKFSILPCIFIQLQYSLLTILQDELFVVQIDGNYPLYLALDQVKKILKLDVLENNLVYPTGKDVIIALLDSGIDNSINGLKNIEVIERINITNEKELDTCGHGTIMASILGVNKNFEDFKLKGLAPNVKLIDVKIVDKEGKSSLFDALVALEILKNKEFDILHFGAVTLIPTDGWDILSRFCKYFYDKNIIIVAPAGNYGPENFTIGSPASSNYVFCIGASDKFGNIAFFSSRGPTLDGKLKPDFVMPGSKIRTIYPKPKSNSINNFKIVNTLKDFYDLLEISGTSVSSIIFTSIIAFILELYPKLSINYLKMILKQSTKSLHYSRHSQGYGQVSLLNLLKKLNLIIQKPLSFRNLNLYSLKISLLFILGIVIFSIIFIIIRNI